jgi:hypothetical protein
MDNTIQRLNAWVEETVKRLQEVPPSDLRQCADLINLKTEIELAVGRLELCEKWGIYPKSIIRALPQQKCQTPSSDYRIVEDCETNDRQWWLEADFDGQQFRFHQGDLIIEP